MLILRWLLNTLTLLIVSYIVPGFTVDGLWAALVAALILGLVNVFIRPLLLILTLPVNLLTLGVFTLVINALMLWLVSTIVDNFSIDGFATAFLGAVVFWIVSMILDLIFKPKAA